MTPISTKKHIVASLFLLLFALNTAQAQQRVCTRYVPYSGYSDSLFADLKNVEAGDSYAKCFIPNEYETFADSNFVVEKSNFITKNQKVIVIEPIIAEVTDSIILKKISTKWVINTKIQPPKGIRILAPVYKDSLVQVVIEKGKTKWVQKRGDANCFSQNPDYCLMFYLIEVPARYNTLHNLKQIQPLRKIVGRDTIALDSAELTKYGAIETSYKQISYYREVLKQVGRVEFPTAKNAKYISPTKKLVRKGGMSEWKKIICCGGRMVSEPKINVIQKSLKARGYYKGKIDNILGAETKAALVKFQKDNGLRIGSLDLQTLKALGVGYL